MARASLERESGSPFSQRGFVIAAVAVAVLAVLGVVLGISGGHHHAQRPGNTANRPAGSAAVPGVPATARVRGPNHCSLGARSQAVPDSSPQAQWTLLGSMAIPTSDRIGPQRKVDGFPVCYARDPDGALFAAVAFWAAGTAYPPSDVYAHLAADTRLRKAAIASSAGDNERLSDHGQVNLAGFRFSSYTPTTANVTIVLQTTQDVMVSVGCTMLWQHGDWHYEIPPAGQPPASQIDSLTGFVAWGAAS